MRYLVATILGGALNFTREELSISRVVFATGLPSFVMAQLPQIWDPNGVHFLTPGLYPDICMPIVLGMIPYSGLVSPFLISNDLASGKDEKPGEAPIEPEEVSEPEATPNTSI